MKKRATRRTSPDDPTGFFDDLCAYLDARGPTPARPVALDRKRGTVTVTLPAPGCGQDAPPPSVYQLSEITDLETLRREAVNLLLGGDKAIVDLFCATVAKAKTWRRPSPKGGS